jgi:hypothetical protein
MFLLSREESARALRLLFASGQQAHHPSRFCGTITKFDGFSASLSPAAKADHMAHASTRP